MRRVARLLKPVSTSPIYHALLRMDPNDFEMILVVIGAILSFIVLLIAAGWLSHDIWTDGKPPASWSDSSLVFFLCLLVGLLSGILAFAVLASTAGRFCMRWFRRRKILQ